MFQPKEWDITSEVLNEVEMSNPPDKEYKVMIIKMLTDAAEKWMNIENVNKEML